MGFLLSFIFLSLAFCFVVGLLLGLLWWWYRRRVESAEYQRQLLEVDAEADRLRLRVNSLKSAESRADALSAELDASRKELERLADLESEVTTLRVRADLVPDLEKRVASLRSKADRAGSLEARLSDISADVDRIPDLEAEIKRLTVEADRTGSLAAELVALQAVAARVPDLEGTISRLEGDGERVAELEGRVESLVAELDDAREQSAQKAGVQSETRSEPEVREFEAAVSSLNDELSSRDATIEGLRADLASVNAEAGRVSGLEHELETTRARAARVEELEGELHRLRSEADRVSHLESQLGQAENELHAAQVEVRGAREAVERAKEGSAEIIAALRRQLESAEAGAALVAQREETIADLRRRLSEAEAAPDGEYVGGTAETVDGPDENDLDDDDDSSVDGDGGDSGDAPSWQKGTTKLGTPGAGHIDDLKRIHGIGPVMERTLQSFGIQTWEQVAAFTTDDIEKVTEAIDAFPGRIERDDWVGGARALLAAGHEPGDPNPTDESTNGLEMPSGNVETAGGSGSSDDVDARSWQQGTTSLGTPGAGHTDDLKVINGIGPVMEKTLQSFGIQTWEQLAALEEHDVAKVTEAIGTFPGRIERDEWIRQADDLVRRFPLRSPYDRPTRKTFLNESVGG